MIETSGSLAPSLLSLHQAGDMTGAISIGIGLLINVLFIELIGITAGGMVVPGYIALNLHSPLSIAVTILLGFVTFACVRGLSNYFLIFGKRFLLFCILIGFTLTMLFNNLAGHFNISGMDYYLQAVGYIVPGLIGYWIERQGTVKTVCAMIVGASLTRFLLVIATELKLIT